MRQNIAVVQFGPNNTAGNLLGDVTTQHWSNVSKSRNVVVAGAHCQHNMLIEAHGVVERTSNNFKLSFTAMLQLATVRCDGGGEGA